MKVGVSSIPGMSNIWIAHIRHHSNFIDPMLMWSLNVILFIHSDIQRFKFTIRICHLQSRVINKRNVWKPYMSSLGLKHDEISEVSRHFKHVQLYKRHWDRKYWLEYYIKRSHSLCDTFCVIRLSGLRFFNDEEFWHCYEPVLIEYHQKGRLRLQSEEIETNGSVHRFGR